MPANKNYIELEIAFNQSNYDLIYNVLYVNDINTILEENGMLKVYFSEDDSQKVEFIKNELVKNNDVLPADVSIGVFDNKDWNKEWERTIEPVYISDKLVIYPSWKKDSLDLTGGRLAIEIDPKMSFGTGHNETTQLILEQMSAYLDPDTDKYFLDFGSGTGILAIAAVKLGVESVAAIEIDDDSIENAQDYIKLNDVSKNITLYQKDISEIKETGFDVIAANITSNIIIPNLKQMNEKLKAGGKLFITGILKEETDELINNLTLNNFLLKELKQKAEWSAFYAIKHNS
jgi:ribosomal protein L11 methyltransferase